MITAGNRPTGASIPRMGFEPRTRKYIRIAAIMAGALWCIAFGVMWAVDHWTGRPPTGVWLRLLGPLFVVVAVDAVVNCEEHSSRWRGTWVEQPPEHYIRLGLLGVVIGGVMTVVGILGGAGLSWFQ